MALESPQIAPNFAAGNYFNILHFRGICSPGEPEPRLEVWVGFYASEQARRANVNPMYQHQWNILFDDLKDVPAPPFLGDPRAWLYELIKERRPAELFPADAPVIDV